MQIRLGLSTSRDRCDVVVDAAVATDVGAMRAAVTAAAGVPIDSSWWSGRRLLPDTALLGGPGLRTGDEVWFGGPGPAVDAEPSPLHLAVVGGPGAGAVLALGRGVHLLGRGEFCDLRLPDAEVSRRHAAVTVTTAGVNVRDLDSRHGTTRGGLVVDRDGGELEPGDELRVGMSTVVLRAGLPVRSPVRASDDGRLLVLRSADLRPDTVARTLTAPEPPTARGRPAVAWVAALVPALAALGLAWFLHTWQLLAFAALSPLTVLATATGDRWSWRAGRRRAASEHAAQAARFDDDRRQLLRAERQARLAAHPDAPRCVQAAQGPAAPLWQRRNATPDAWQVRIGTATRPSRTSVLDADGDVAPAGELADVPVCADLARGPLGIAGPAAYSLASTRAAIVQLAVAHPPGELEFVLLLPDDPGDAWDWVRWLPHRVRRAADAATRRALLGELTDRIDATPRTWGMRPRPAGPTTVIVADRPGSLDERAQLDRVLTSGGGAGVRAVCVDRTRSALPASCTAVAVADGATLALLALDGDGWDTDSGEPDVAGPVVADHVDADWCSTLARGLAPLADGAEDAALPRRVRLRDLLDVRSEDDVLGAWRRRPPASMPALRAVVGLDAQGVVELDLDADGPHALVAGTTGAGKSEFLQTWLVALATAHAPDDVGFLLVDYKGGAAFGACSRLPHTLGLVTDLDHHLTARVLRSLEAEIRRRERLFAAVDAADLAAFRRRGRHGDDGATVPRLLVVVDEFATLAAELPDFVTGLVDVAQRGRSLGLHLVLATQRPGHAVSPAIRANVSLRIALRVTDPGESTDVIGGPDAAALDPSCPGRAIVRTGRQQTPVQFAWAGTPVGDQERAVRAHRVRPWEDPPSIPPGHDRRTDLDDLVELVAKAWARRFTDGATPPSPTWLPPLPEQLVPGDLTGRAERADRDPRPTLVPIGLRDRPDRQTQVVEHLDLAAGGTLLVAGAARTGRTELLRGIAHAAAAVGTPTVVVDTGALEHLTALTTTEARVDAADTETIGRLIDQLEREYAARREHPTDRPPLLVLVDGWTAVASALDEVDAGRSTERLLTMWRTAGSVGVTVVVTGDRSALGTRSASAADRMWVLRLPDPADVAMVGLNPRDVPGRMPAGRALSVPDGEVVQCARAGPAPAVVTTGRTVTGLRLRPLPPRFELVARSPDPAAGALLRLGVGGDGCGLLDADPWAGDGRWLVAGPPRSGRSSTLCLLASEAATAGATVQWWARPHSPLAVIGTARGWDALSAELPALADATQRRRLVVLDDVDDLADTPLSDAVARALRATGPGLLAVVCSGRPDELLVSYRGVVAETRRARRGIVLHPGPADGDLVGIRTGRAAAGAPPGRGVVVVDGLRIDGVAIAPGPVAVQVGWPAARVGRLRAA